LKIEGNGHRGKWTGRLRFDTGNGNGPCGGKAEGLRVRVGKKI
jgi:hypothetical protein